MEKLAQGRTWLLARVEKIAFIGPALARLTVGVVFAQTGWGKLHNLAHVTAFFEDLHIPHPHANAVLVGSTELICGSLLLIGLLTRLAAIPLICTMTVAIITAKLSDVAGLGDLLGLEEFTYIVIFVWLALAGPGWLSVDGLLARLLRKTAPDKK